MAKKKNTLVANEDICPICKSKLTLISKNMRKCSESKCYYVRQTFENKRKPELVKVEVPVSYTHLTLPTTPYV